MSIWRPLGYTAAMYVSNLTSAEKEVCSCWKNTMKWLWPVVFWTEIRFFHFCRIEMLLRGTCPYGAELFTVPLWVLFSDWLSAAMLVNRPLGCMLLYIIYVWYERDPVSRMKCYLPLTVSKWLAWSVWAEREARLKLPELSLSFEMQETLKVNAGVKAVHRFTCLFLMLPVVCKYLPKALLWYQIFGCVWARTRQSKTRKWHCTWVLCDHILWE